MSADMPGCGAMRAKVRAAYDTETRAPITLDCGHTVIPAEHMPATGYAIDAQGRKLCFACCDTLQRVEIQDQNHAFGYLKGPDSAGQLRRAGWVDTTPRNYEIVTWSGGHLMRVTGIRVVTLRNPQGYTYRRVYVQAIDGCGGVWSGTGPYDSGNYVRLRRRAIRASVRKRRDGWVPTTREGSPLTDERYAKRADAVDAWRFLCNVPAAWVVH